MKEKIVGLKELRQNIDKYARGVKKGEEYVVMRKSTPLFKLVPTDSESGWETVIDFTEHEKSGVSLDKVLKRI